MEVLVVAVLALSVVTLIAYGFFSALIQIVRCSESDFKRVGSSRTQWLLLVILGWFAGLGWLFGWIFLLTTNKRLKTISPSAEFETSKWEPDQLRDVISSLSVLQASDVRFSFEFDGKTLKSLLPDHDNKFKTLVAELTDTQFGNEVIYPLRDWTSEQIRGLTSELLEGKIPFSMENSDLVIDVEYEDVTDPLVFKYEPKRP